MLLYYHMEPEGNFGDDLNPFLWNRLMPGVFSGTLSHDPRERTVPVGEPIFVGIGTLLNERIPTEAEKHVFGSGVGYGTLPIIDKHWHILCVRGPLSAKALGIQGREITDPAALVSRLEIKPRTPQSRTSFMPHISSTIPKTWEVICDDLGIRYIDPRKEVQEILSDISGSEMLITEAMHGAIVADALRVPWVAVASGNVLAFKWLDWCASLGMEYRFHRIPRIWLPDSSVRGKMSYAVKMGLAARLLRRIIANPRAALSSEGTLQRLCSQLEERLFYFKEQVARSRN